MERNGCSRSAEIRTCSKTMAGLALQRAIAHPGGPDWQINSTCCVLDADVVLEAGSRGETRKGVGRSLPLIFCPIGLLTAASILADFRQPTAFPHRLRVESASPQYHTLRSAEVTSSRGAGVPFRLALDMGTNSGIVPGGVDLL